MRKALFRSAVLCTLACIAAHADPLPPLNQGAQSSAPLPDAVCSSLSACLSIGAFTPTFVEPVIYSRAPDTQQGGLPPPLQNPLRPIPMDGRCSYGPDGRPLACKPTGASVANLPDGRILFFNNLEGTENVEFSIVAEGGGAVINDQTRVMTLNTANKTATWTVPGSADGGADEQGNGPCLLPGCLLNTDQGPEPRANSGALFCADLKALYDGRIIAVGGTNYYSEPGVTFPGKNPFTLGVVELEGLRASRIFNPADNTWAQTGSMNFGRWYPALTTLPNGDLFVVSGVTKLLKPVYPDRLLASGRNVVETETFDLGTGTWTDNSGPAQRSLPLFPRMHLLPNGQVFYDAGGQAFSPFGQSYDQPLWNIVGAYDPATKTWTDLGYAGLPLQLNQVGLDQIVSALNPTNPLIANALILTLRGLLGQTISDPAAQLGAVGGLLGLGGPTLNDKVGAAIGSGMRGSTFSSMMTMRPNASGAYDKAQFLVAGGTLTAVAATNPGTYLATTLSRLETVDVSGGTMKYSSKQTGSLNLPRWYGTPALLPTGQLMLFSGANRDEVVLPGSGSPVLKTEMFDPATETWKLMATQNNPRTYHNTALLLQDGRVLVGGHAPINTAYAFSLDLTPFGISPNYGHDPSWEIYSPPYVFRPRPTITSASTSAVAGGAISVTTPQAASIASVVLVRRTALTHDVDADQRTVELKVTSRVGNTLQMTIPNRNVLPPGQYMLFINQNTSNGLAPSISAPVLIGGADLT